MNGGGAVQAVKVVKREENAGEEPAKKKKKGENGASCSKVKSRYCYLLD